MGVFNHFLKELREKGSLKQILKKYESGAQVCPDMSGQPLGFESCFTAFLVLLGGLAVGLIVMLLECISGQDKTIPYLDSYGKDEASSLDSLEPGQMENILAYKDAIIANLRLDVLHLERKLKSVNSHTKLV